MKMEMQEKKKTGIAILTPDKIDIKRRSLTRDKEGFSDFTSGHLSEEIQNTKSKRHMHAYVLCSIIHNSQDMKVP